MDLGQKNQISSKGMTMFVVEWSDPLQHFFVVVIDQDHCWEGLHWLILLRKTFRRHSLSAVVV